MTFENIPLKALPIIIIMFTPLEFFTSALADGLSLEFEWQQVSSSHQDSSSILAVLNNADVWMVSTRLPNLKSLLLLLSLFLLQIFHWCVSLLSPPGQFSVFSISAML